jgi:hypothetical protein
MDYTDEAVRLYRRWRQERATAERFRSTQILRAPVAVLVTPWASSFSGEGERSRNATGRPSGDPYSVAPTPNSRSRNVQRERLICAFGPATQ